MGFHILGLAVSLVILLPNLFFFLYPPRNMQKGLAKEPVALTMIENIGRIGCFLYPLFFGADIAASLPHSAMYLMLACVLLYYVCWIRFFLGRREFSLLFRPLWWIPIPMAVFPAVYFLSLAVLVRSLLMGVAAICFTLGHIPISYMTWKQVKIKGGAQ